MGANLLRRYGVPVCVRGGRVDLRRDDGGAGTEVNTPTEEPPPPTAMGSDAVKYYLTQRGEKVFIWEWDGARWNKLSEDRCRDIKTIGEVRGG